jgi:signal transduction histidine kinase/pSer/pThr/pTyr-binding forkhead associated (FHA) protein
VLTLLVLQGPDKGRRFELPDATALIGRDSRQLPMTDNTVSRRHCELTPTEGDWALNDLGSANGTYVNGIRITGRCELKLGDQIRVGRTLMVFGAQPGVTRTSSGSVTFSGEEAGMDSAIMHTVSSNDDSMVLAVPEPAAVAMTNLKLLYALGASLGSGFDVEQVMEVVMDLVFEHMKVDRGIILLIDERTGELVTKIVRTREEESTESRAAPGAAGAAAAPTDRATATPGAADSSTPAADAGNDGSKVGQPIIHAPRTIINHVLSSGEGVLSSNAMSDRRFSKGKSVQDLGIRSALCVPIKARKLTASAGDEIIGLIYIDSQVKNYTYAPDQLRLLTAIGLQAGMAIQNAKLYQAGLQAERMAAVGETTAALSHSIKNILQALRGGADVVEMGLRGNNLNQAAKGWRVVDRNLERIYNLTMNLLAYSRPREPKLESVNPRALINECLELVAPFANEKGVMAVADVDPDIPPVPLDPDGIHQVLMNLLSNALDAVEPNAGLIRVICRYLPENRELLIEVIDNGIGIPPAMKDHVFELFHSTKGNRGTGLGLAVAKKIIDEHDGSISVRTNVGEGATFTILLPVHQETLADPSHTHGPAR